MSSEFKSHDEIMREQREKGETFAKTLADFCNTYSEERLKAAAAYLANDSNVHRSGQTAIMRLFLLFAQEMAQKASEGRHDGRNEKACQVAQGIHPDYLLTCLSR